MVNVEFGNSPIGKYLPKQNYFVAWMQVHTENGTARHGFWVYLLNIPFDPVEIKCRTDRPTHRPYINFIAKPFEDFLYATRWLYLFARIAQFIGDRSNGDCKWRHHFHIRLAQTQPINVITIFVHAKFEFCSFSCGCQNFVCNFVSVLMPHFLHTLIFVWMFLVLTHWLTLDTQCVSLLKFLVCFVYLGLIFRTTFERRNHMSVCALRDSDETTPNVSANELN